MKKYSFLEKIKLFKSLNNINKEIEDAYNELDKVKNMIEAKNVELSCLKDAIDMLKKSSQEMQIRYDELKEKLNCANNIESLKEENKKLQNQAEELKNSIQEKTGIIRGLIDIDTTKSRLNALRQELTNLTEIKESLLTLENLNNEIEKAKNMLDKFIPNKNLFICEYNYSKEDIINGNYIGVFKKEKLIDRGTYRGFSYTNVINKGIIGLVNSGGKSNNSIYFEHSDNRYGNVELKKAISLEDIFIKMGDMDMIKREKFLVDEIYKIIYYVGINSEMFGFDKISFYTNIDEEVKKELLKKI